MIDRGRGFLMLAVLGKLRTDFLLDGLAPALDLMVEAKVLSDWTYYGESLGTIGHDSTMCELLLIVDSSDPDSEKTKRRVTEVLEPVLAAFRGEWRELPRLAMDRAQFDAMLERRYGDLTGRIIHEDFSSHDTRFALATLREALEGRKGQSTDPLQIGLASFIYFLDLFRVGPERRCDLGGWIKDITQSFYNEEETGKLVSGANAMLDTLPAVGAYLHGLCGGDWGRYASLFDEAAPEFEKLVARFYANEDGKTRSRPFDLIIFANFIHAHNFRIGLSNDREGILIALVQEFYRRNPSCLPRD